MRARLFGGIGLLAGLGAFFLPAIKATAPAKPPPGRRVNGHNGRSNNPMGTTPNRSLRRIQGRQRAMRFGG